MKNIISFNEGFLNRKDNDIADKIISKLDSVINPKIKMDVTVDETEILNIRNTIKLVDDSTGKKYSAHIGDFEVSSIYDMDMFDVVRPFGYYKTTLNGTILDIGFFKAKKIHDKLSRIYNNNNDDDDFVKKDFRISNGI